MVCLATLYWNPSRILFQWNIPWVDRPIYWYGLFFALGFGLAYLCFSALMKRQSALLKELKKPILTFIDSITFWSAIGIVLGARLFDVVFYQGLSSFKDRPLAIFYAWEGGLASHGGVLGLMVALYFLLKSKSAKFRYTVLDCIPIPALILGTWIRIGNFFNQEILGKASELPWAVTFGSPIDGSYPISRHPVQLYEALLYFTVALVSFWAVKKGKLLFGSGKIFAVHLLVVFSLRFFVEGFKEEQSVFLQHFPLTMGQLLSLPCIALGAFFARRKVLFAPVEDKTGRNAG